MLHDTDFDFAFGGCGDTTYFTIPDLGPTCGNVSGTVVIDADEDCVLDFTDAAIPQMILEFMPGPYYATTNAYGEYSINLPLGNYTVEQQTALVDEHCVGNPGPLSVAGNMTFNLLDTATQALDIQLSLASGPARPGFELHYAIDLDNLTSATSNSNMVVMTFDPAVSYIGATPTPSNVSGNTITWNNAGALYYFQHRDISVRLQVPPDVGLIGTDLQATATVTPNAADVNAANNSATVITTVTGSYDPNDKTATTSSAWSRDLYYIDVDQWIDYTIRFQNTGTDTAFTVVMRIRFEHTRRRFAHHRRRLASVHLGIAGQWHLEVLLREHPLARQQRERTRESRIRVFPCATYASTIARHRDREHRQHLLRFQPASDRPSRAC
ncbi:MAG: hypothetical protein IPJ87_01420 [Flavobacteriales bacterium]|nr:hypothetical protein [Flavobacteriales bacterium]